MQPELGDDVVADARGGRGRVRVQADAGQQLPQPAELAVLRPKVVAPLADAVRFVDGDEARRRTTTRSARKPSLPSPTSRSGET